MTIFDRPPTNSPVRGLLYGTGTRMRPSSPLEGGNLFRLERAQPFYRLGKPVYAVPQFRALNLFSPTSQNALLPTLAVTPTRIAYPVKVK